MNRMREAWSRGEPSIGTYAPMAALEAEETGAAGYDWAWFDIQHGAMGLESLLPLIQALELGGTRPVVRASWNEPAAIMRPLDLGAVGIIVPMLDGPEAADRAARAMRYPPDGYRSWGQRRRPYDTAAEANADIVCIAMIETREGLDRAEEIAAVPGVDVLFMAPSDLGLGLGLGPYQLHHDRDAAHRIVGRLVVAARRHGKIAGAISTDEDQTEALLQIGAGWVSSAPLREPRAQIAGWKARYARRQPQP